MQRRIIGFHQDDEQQWVAELDCGHNRHVRHLPPFSERPWTQDEAGRTAMIGREVACVRCARGEGVDPTV